MSKNKKVKNSTRWRYYIDKRFQNKFMFGFSAIIILSSILIIGLLWLVRENPYSLLPNSAPVLVDIDSSRAIVVSKKEFKKKQKKKKKGKKKKEVTYVEDFVGGTTYFPVKIQDGMLAKYNAFDIYWYPILILSIINTVLVMIFGLFFSHRMAGPIHRIKQFLSSYLKNGNVSYLKLREKDHFKDIALLLNRVFNLQESPSSPKPTSDEPMGESPNQANETNNETGK